MESSSEVVYEEQTKSSVSKKCVQQVSATASIQKMAASTSLAGEKSIMSMLGSDGGLVGNEILALQNEATALALPSVPADGNTVSTTSLQSEFSAMKLKDDFGNEIGEIVQEKQQEESVQASSTVTEFGSSSSKSSASLTQVSSTTSKVQQSTKSVIAEAQESSSSVSCSSYSSTEKQEIKSSSTRSLSSIKSSQSIEKVLTSSTAVVEDHEF